MGLGCVGRFLWRSFGGEFESGGIEPPAQVLDFPLVIHLVLTQFGLVGTEDKQEAVTSINAVASFQEKLVIQVFFKQHVVRVLLDLHLPGTPLAVEAVRLEDPQHILGTLVVSLRT